MGNMVKQAKSELKQLPAMLGKLLGGVMAVVGFASTVWIITRGTDWVLADIGGYLGVGVVGIIVFVLSSRLLARRCAETPAEVTLPKESSRTSMLAWGILLLLVVLFLVCTYFLTR